MNLFYYIFFYLSMRIDSVIVIMGMYSSPLTPALFLNIRQIYFLWFFCCPPENDKKNIWILMLVT